MSVRAGYLGGRSGPNSVENARTLGNTTAGGSTRRNGGSYGGVGGIGNAEGVLNSVYGAFDDPTELGSGGGSDGNGGGNGGGLVRITAHNLTLNGKILANGGNGAYLGGGGSGGGIKIVAGTFSGSGLIQANGGTGDGYSGDGGGGRIAIFYSNPTTFAATNAQAYGGRSGYQEGTPGTVYLHHEGSAGELVVDGNSTNNISAATPLYSLATGTSTGMDAYSLADRRALFNPGTLVGLRLKPNINSSQTFRIVAVSKARLFTDLRTDG